MESGIYRIGEFSKKTGFSVKTLRYYDEIGLLKPSIVDKFTNYRYYTDDDKESAEVIKFLKSVDFSLEEIINNKDNLSSDVLEAKQRSLMDKMEKLQLMYDELEVVRKRIRGKVLKLETRKRDENE
ncbi:MAG: MerR family transcriptional regulator [Bacilli bacterium]|nr:MerR family transcriptional regulator [Bacilli bacterium]